MKNNYNKGKYRSFEYAKHLRPFLKASGNRKWRKTATSEIEAVINESQITKLEEVKCISTKQKKLIRVKIKEVGARDKKRTSVRKYKTIRAALDAMKRNRVVEGRVIS